MAEFPADQHDAGTLRLQPWASVRGQFRDGGKPVKDARIFLQPGSPRQPRSTESRCQRLQARHRQGRPLRVPARAAGSRQRPGLLGPWKDAGFRSGPSVPLDLKPGQQVELDLGGRGPS